MSLLRFGFNKINVFFLVPSLFYKKRVIPLVIHIKITAVLKVA